MKLRQPNFRHAFTLLEGIIVIAVLVFVALTLIPDRSRVKPKAPNIICMNNLWDMGLSIRSWADDNNGKYPMNVPVNLGGAQELMATGNLAGFYRCMKNLPDGLFNPEELICPLDAQHKAAKSFEVLSNSNLSYFIGLAATKTNSPTVLAGDANLLQNDLPVSTGMIDLWSNSAAWTADRHHGSGNVLLPDGSVRTIRKIGFTSSTGTYFATNRIVIP